MAYNGISSYRIQQDLLIQLNSLFLSCFALPHSPTHRFLGQMSGTVSRIPAKTASCPTQPMVLGHRFPNNHMSHHIPKDARKWLVLYTQRRNLTKHPMKYPIGHITIFGWLYPTIFGQYHAQGFSKLLELFDSHKWFGEFAVLLLDSPYLPYLYLGCWEQVWYKHPGTLLFTPKIAGKSMSIPLKHTSDPFPYHQVFWCISLYHSTHHPHDPWCLHFCWLSWVHIFLLNSSCSPKMGENNNTNNYI